MTDPDLEIRGGGGPVIQTLKLGGEQSPKTLFLPLGPQFGLKIGGGALLPPPLDPPLECGREEKPDAKAVFCPFIVFKKQCHLPR